MGKKLVKSESEIRKGMMLPNKHDILGIVTKNLGYTRFIVKCQDGNTRQTRVRGKMKKRNWVREGDVVLVSPWEFNPDKKGDIIFRYTENQAHWLRDQNYLQIN
jgi:translation initiation factor 1A